MKRNETGRYQDYPYVSPCGKEMNYVKVDDLPVVFHDLVENETNRTVLLYGGNLEEPFDPLRLAVCPESGRFYHQCDPVKSPLGRKHGYGLISSYLALRLNEEHLSTTDDGFQFTWRGETTVIAFLPKPDAESSGLQVDT